MPDSKGACAHLGKGMATILDDVNKRTQLAGNNRMELLLFKLQGRQRYGINVFKVREVIQCPQLTQIPRSKAVVAGVVTIRGVTIPIVDLSRAVGMKPVADPRKCFVIVAEYNRSVQGFLVNAVERIVNMQWDEVQPPPRASGMNHYLTAVTKVDDEIVEIIDVEKVLSEIVQLPSQISGDLKVQSDESNQKDWFVLIADDSSVARNQVERTLTQVGLRCVKAENGKQALTLLQGWAQNEPEKLSELAMVISDIEMPEMDGYTLTAELRRNPAFKGLYVLLHTSLSGVFNEALVEQVGADLFVPKFAADDLARAVIDHVKLLAGRNATA